MRSPLGCVGFELTIQSQAFARRTEQRQEDDRQGAQQQEAVAPLRIGDMRCAEPALSRSRVLLPRLRRADEDDRAQAAGPQALEAPISELIVAGLDRL